MAKKNLNEEIQKLQQINKLTAERIENEKKFDDDTLGKRVDLLNDLESSLGNYNDLKKVERDIEDEMTRLYKNNHDVQADRFNTEKQLTANAIKKIETEKISNSLLSTGNDLTGGMADKAKETFDTFKEFGPKVAFISAGLMAATAILLSFSGQLDAIGEQFGAIGVQEFSKDLMGADAEMTKLGYDSGTAANIASKLSTEFGVGFKESIGLASEVGNMSKALGMSAEEGAGLVGQLTSIGGISADTAIQYAKQTEMLAAQEGVAPGAVMKDIAGNAEVFARFGKDGGKNLMGAAIQAKKLGTDLGTVAGIADGLLDFQSSIQAEMEASVLIGRQLNYQKARELALNNDIEGAMSEIISQVGSEAEFNEMNAIQRKALADSIGVSVDQMAKFVTNQDKAATLTERIAEQEGFADLVGEDAMSSLAELMGSLKAIGAQLTNVLGPTLNAIVGVFSNLATKLQESKGLMTALQVVVGALGVKLLFMGLSALWSGAFSALGWIPVVGPVLATAAAVAGTAAILSAVYQSLSPAGDMMSPAGRKTVVSTKEGGLFKMSDNDDLLAGPGIAKATAGGKQSNEIRQNNELMGKLIENFDKKYVPALVQSNIDGAKESSKGFGRTLATNAG